MATKKMVNTQRTMSCKTLINMWQSFKPFMHSQNNCVFHAYKSRPTCLHSSL